MSETIEHFACVVDAHKLYRASLCRSDEYTRYSIQGVHIEPQPSGGVLMIGTNGATLVCLTDQDGWANRAGTIRLDKASLRAAQKTAKHGTENPSARCVVRGTLASIVAPQSTTPYTIEEYREALELALRGKAPDSLATLQWRDALIESDFPDWRRALPVEFAAMPADRSVSARYCNLLAQALTPLSALQECGLHFYPTANAGPIVVLSDINAADGFGILMPRQSCLPSETDPAAILNNVRSKTAEMRLKELPDGAP